MRRPIAAGRAAVVLAAISAMTGGCAEWNQQARLRAELETSRQEIKKLTAQRDQLQQQLTGKDEQIANLLALGERRLENLFYVERIKLGRYTGGVDLDSKGGDDAVKVYLKPIDQYGNVIKAAGEVKIQLYDLAAEPNENLIGQYVWPANKISQQWSGGFVAYHYAFVCPWKLGAPKHEEITVRVEFTDYLTGRQFSEQTLCKVKLPAATD